MVGKKSTKIEHVEILKVYHKNAMQSKMSHQYKTLRIPPCVTVYTSATVIRLKLNDMTIYYQ